MKLIKKMMFFVVAIIIVSSAKIIIKAELPGDLDMCTPNAGKENTECQYNFRVNLGYNWECMEKTGSKCKARVIEA